MTHVSDGDLLRLLDGEAGATEHLELEAHVDSCEDCADRYLALRRKIAAVSGAIRRADVVPAKSKARMWGLRAAAVIVFMAMGLAVTPVRAWIAEQTRALWAVVSGEEQTANTESQVAIAARSDPTAAVSFVPAGEVFVIELAVRQAAGRLTVETVAGNMASATVYGGTDNERLVVLPSGLRIVNGPTAEANYTIELPATLAHLLVVIGNDDTLRYDPSGVPERWDVDLAASAPNQ